MPGLIIPILQLRKLRLKEVPIIFARSQLEPPESTQKSLCSPLLPYPLLPTALASPVLLPLPVTQILMLGVHVPSISINSELQLCCLPALHLNSGLLIAFFCTLATFRPLDWVWREDLGDGINPVLELLTD